MSNLLKKELINWYAWSEEALQQAKDENKSIFLFVSDSTSQWSKKMQEESFKNDIII